MRAAPLAAAVLAAPILAGCATLLAERIWEGQRLNAVTPVEFSSFAASGAVVEILGTPPGGAPPEAVAAVLRMPGQYPQAPFRLATADQTRTPAQGALRLVIAFGLAGPADGRLLCAGGAAVPAKPPQTGLEATAALCVGPNADSAARLSHAEPLEPGDPRFAATMTRLIQVLSPRAAEFRGRRGGCLLPGCG